VRDGASPYERLGIAPDASFDYVAGSPQDRLSARTTPGLPQWETPKHVRSDGRLRERQQGKVSSAR